MYTKPQREDLPDVESATVLLSAARATGQSRLSEPQAKALLRLGGIATPCGGVATSAAEAAALAARLTPPLALKIVAPDVLHKSDIGGIELNVGREAQAQAYARIAERVRTNCPETRVDGILVEEMQSGGVEMVASVRRDAQLGWVLMVGLGGMWVEVLRDVSFRLVPLERSDILEMLNELRGSALLDAIRGRGAVDREALVEALRRLSDLAETYQQELLEIEINPLVVLPRGVCAVDAVISLRGDH